MILQDCSTIQDAQNILQNYFNGLYYDPETKFFHKYKLQYGSYTGEYYLIKDLDNYYDKNGNLVKIIS